MATITLSVTPLASATQKDFNFANAAPANGAHLAYADWIAGGRYVQFTVQPDTSYPCGSEYYFLEINGRRVGQFGTNCTASIYLSTTGSYSWRADLYIFETGITVTGPVSTLTVDQEAAAFQSTGAIATPATPQDMTAPHVKAESGTLTVGQTDKLIFVAGDNSGAATLVLVVSGPGTHWTRTLRNVGVTGIAYSAAWHPQRRGRYAFCIGAVDASGNASATSCSKVIVI